jgi:hypothetical protein
MKDQIAWSYSTHEGKEKFVRYLQENVEERDSLEDFDLDGL